MTPTRESAARPWNLANPTGGAGKVQDLSLSSVSAAGSQEKSDSSAAGGEVQGDRAGPLAGGEAHPAVGEAERDAADPDAADGVGAALQKLPAASQLRTPSRSTSRPGMDSQRRGARPATARTCAPRRGLGDGRARRPGSLLGERPESPPASAAAASAAGSSPHATSRLGFRWNECARASDWEWTKWGIGDSLVRIGTLAKLGRKRRMFWTKLPSSNLILCALDLFYSA
jgi:hypothetical protein